MNRARPFDLVGRVLRWLCGGRLALNLLLILGRVVLLAANGGSYFWQRPLTLLTVRDGTKVLGEVQRTEPIPETAPGAVPARRVELKVAHRDLTGADFLWEDEGSIASRELPSGAMLLERLEWGNFYG